MTVPDIDALREKVVGYQFPGGTFEVAEFERWLSHDAMRAPSLPGNALHPVWILLGALRGMGIKREELTELVEARVQDGTVFGETVMEQHRPLRAGVLYTVRGSVTDLVRRVGQRAGTMDLMTFRLELVEPEGGVAAAAAQTFIYPRREA